DDTACAVHASASGVYGTDVAVRTKLKELARVSSGAAALARARSSALPRQQALGALATNGNPSGASDGSEALDAERASPSHAINGSAGSSFHRASSSTA